MRTQSRWLIAAATVYVLLVGATLSVSANPAPWQQAGAVRALPSGAWAGAAPDEKKCTKLEIVGDVKWFAVDEEGYVDGDAVVEGYDDLTPAIAPGFEYSCAPKNTTIVSFFTLQEMDIISEYATETTRLTPSNKGGIFVQPLEGELPEGMCEGCEPDPNAEPRLATGRYVVEFCLNEELLASGETTVGDVGNGEAGWVTVRGEVRDESTRKPIEGANVVILKPGVRFSDWIDDTDEDWTDTIYTYGISDRKGMFTLEEPLEREIAYTIVTWATGYRGFYYDDFVIEPDDPDPLEITLDLERLEYRDHNASTAGVWLPSAPHPAPGP